MNVISMEFLQALLRRHLEGKPVVTSLNAGGCLLRLLEDHPLQKSPDVRKIKTTLEIKFFSYFYLIFTL